MVAPSFSPIFYGNCVRNGIVPVKLPAEAVASLAAEVEGDPAGTPLTVDLLRQKVTSPGGKDYDFPIESEAREMLLEGLDAIDLTLKQRAAIEAFLARDRAARPWIYL